MPQADVSKLVSQLKVNVEPTYRRLKNPKGPEGRHDIIRKIVTGLFKYERIELLYTKADEARPYAERLISDAIRHGDCHKPTMEMADYWIEEKQVVHKLFKVLAPRYQNYNVSYTRMFKVFGHYPNGRYPRSLLELKGNPFPPLTQDLSSNRNLIHNVLLDEAKKQYRAQKYAEMAEQLSSQDSASGTLPEQLSSQDSASGTLPEQLSSQDSTSGTLPEQLSLQDSASSTDLSDTKPQEEKETSKKQNSENETLK